MKESHFDTDLKGVNAPQAIKDFLKAREDNHAIQNEPLELPDLSGSVIIPAGTKSYRTTFEESFFI